MSSASKEEKVQFVLNHLRTTPVIPNSSTVLNNKYPNDDEIEHGAILLEMMSLGLIEEGGVKNMHFTLGKLGVEVLNDGGYAKYDLERKQRIIGNDEVQHQHLALLRKTNKMFWCSAGIGIIGGILGLASFIFELNKPPVTDQQINPDTLRTEIKTDSLPKIQEPLTSDTLKKVTDEN